MMILGSPYERLTQVNGRPLTAEHSEVTYLDKPAASARTSDATTLHYLRTLSAQLGSENGEEFPMVGYLLERYPDYRGVPIEALEENARMVFGLIAPIVDSLVGLQSISKEQAHAEMSEMRLPRNRLARLLSLCRVRDPLPCFHGDN